jgi:hypothetical protein
VHEQDTATTGRYLRLAFTGRAQPRAAAVMSSSRPSDPDFRPQIAMRTGVRVRQIVEGARSRTLRKRVNHD